MVEPAGEPEEQEATAYEVHITFPRVMQEKLKKSADLAYKLGLIPKPKLAELMTLHWLGHEYTKKPVPQFLWHLLDRHQHTYYTPCTCLYVRSRVHSFRVF